MDHRDGVAEVNFVDAGWSPDLAGDLAIVEGVAGVDFYRDLVERRDVGTLDVYVNGLRVGSVLYRYDKTEYGREFVVVAGAGHSARFNLVKTVLPALEWIALKTGARQVRFHTARPGLVRRGTMEGYAVSEIVLRKALSDGRPQ